MSRWRATVAGAIAAYLVAASAPARAGGDGDDALPGLPHVALPAVMPGVAAFAASAGYGYRGAVLGADDAHHRANSSLAASYRLRPWLALGLRLDGRYDKHTGAAEGSDDGWVGEPRLYVRTRRELAPGLAAGAQVGLWFPSQGLAGLAGTSIETRALGGYALSDELTLVVNAGFRLDRSARSIDDPDALSLSDRVALGAADANALLLGAGLGWDRGPLSVAATWSWDLLVGANAPSANESPMRLAAEARVAVSADLWLRAGVNLALSSTPLVARGEPLVPVEARASAWLGVTYHFASAAAPPPAAAPPEPTPAPALGGVRGFVSDPTGAPLAGALVRVGTRELVTDDGGAFALDELEPGLTELTIRAPRFRARTVAVTVEAGETTAVGVTLERALPPGQIRGLVRTLAGLPLGGASVTIEPLGQTLSTGDDGAFRADVPPGAYTIEVSAPGHQSQRRALSVDENGVTVINVELQRGTP